MLFPYPASLILHVLYYLELSQGTQAMVNGSHVNFNLTLYFGPANLRTMIPDNICTVILDACLQTGPVVLKKLSGYNLAQANTDSTKIAHDIKTKILKLAWPQICSSVLGEICPGYSNQPQAALEHIRQTFTVKEGDVVTTPIFAYYQRIMNAMLPFSGQDPSRVRCVSFLVRPYSYVKVSTFFQKK
jgi:hypothetical protein